MGGWVRGQSCSESTRIKILTHLKKISVFKCWAGFVWVMLLWGILADEHEPVTWFSEYNVPKIDSGVSSAELNFLLD